MLVLVEMTLYPLLVCLWLMKKVLLQEVEVCKASVGVLGDICRALDSSVAEFSDNVMQVLLQTLSDPTVDRTIKPQILSSFGDISLAVGDKFETYLPHVLPMLQGAQHLSVEQQRTGNEALYDYNTDLRLGILEAYAGIVHALNNTKVAHYISSEVPVRLQEPSCICLCRRQRLEHTAMSTHSVQYNLHAAFAQALC